MTLNPVNLCKGSLSAFLTHPTSSLIQYIQRNEQQGFNKQMTGPRGEDFRHMTNEAGSPPDAKQTLIPSEQARRRFADSPLLASYCVVALPSELDVDGVVIQTSPER